MQYFEHFQNKDIDALSELFCDDITLKDWSISASGKEEVLDAIKNIYNSVEHITISQPLILSNDHVVMAQITIGVDKDTLEVVDIIEYRDDKIESIRAYKS